jgi:hypothetical protein
MLNQTLGPARELSIDLTLVRDAEGNPSCSIRVQAAQMITYDQQIGFTRLRLTGGRVLEVREGTDQIDRLVRGAAANLAGNMPQPDPLRMRAGEYEPDETAAVWAAG